MAMLFPMYSELAFWEMPSGEPDRGVPALEEMSQMLRSPAAVA